MFPLILGILALIVVFSLWIAFVWAITTFDITVTVTRKTGRYINLPAK